MKLRLRRAATVAVVAMLCGSVASAYSQEVTDPTVSVDRTGTQAGEEMLVTGKGWPKAATLVVELCGHGGLDGSVDCDVPHQRTAGVGSSGEFAVQLTVGKPPTPCPCVVKATDQGSGIAATAPIAVAGIPTVPITDEDPGPVRAVEISSIDVTGGGRIAELFGAGGRRVLEVTLVNTGALPVEAPDVSVAWGTGSNPDGFVKPPETKPLEPGETQTITVGLDRPVMTLGDQTAVVEVEGFGEPIVATASTSGYPWGLFVIALVLLQLLLLKIRNRYRRRRDGGSPDDVDGPDEVASLPPGAVAALPPAPEEVIDVRDTETDAVTTVIDVSDPEPEPVDPDREGVSTSGMLLAGLLATVADGSDHEPPPNGNGTTGELNERALLDPEAHAAAVGVLSAGLIAEFTSRTQDLHGKIEAERQRSSAAVHQAARLSEALVAAAAARAEEVHARSERRELEVKERLAEAEEMLDQARAHAGELIDMAQRAAGEILASADLDREAARRALSDVESEREEMVAAAREMVRVATEDLHSRVAGLDDELQAHTTALLHEAGLERQPPAPVDEFDRRLARAVERALTDV